MVRHIGTFLVVLVILSGCGDGGLMLPGLADDGDAMLQTVADGAVLSRDRPLEATLRLRPGQREPDWVEVTFTSQAGTVGASETITAGEIQQGRLPSVAMDSLEPGYYQVEFELYTAGRRTDSVRRKLFLVDGTYRIAGVSAYPPAFMPDSQGILRADLEIADGADPYLRWSFGGQTVSEGLLSAGGGQLLLRSPEAEGVYAVQVELFPFAPPAGGYGFVSELTQQTDLVVRAARLPGERSFGPSTSYYVLMHFAGNLRDSGMRPKLLGATAAEAKLVGDAEPAIVEALFGYQLSDGTAITFDEAVVPFRNGGVGPFSVSMRLVPSGSSSAGLDDTQTATRRSQTFFALEAPDPAFSLNLELSDGNALTAHLQVDRNSSTVTAVVSGLMQRRPVELSFAVVPRSGGTDLAWFVDGELVAGGTTSLTLPLPREGERESERDRASRGEETGWRALEGSTVIGGKNGFSGLIDEFGVFFRDEHDRPSANVAPFRLEQLRRHGEMLLFGDGFESNAVPEGFELEGDGAVTQGVVLLQPGAVLRSPPVKLQGDGITIEVVPRADSRVRLLIGLRGNDGALLQPPHELLPRTGDEGAPLVLHLQMRDRSLLTRFGRLDPVEIPLAPELESLRLEVSNASVESDLGIASITAFRDSGGYFSVIDVP